MCSQLKLLVLTTEKELNRWVFVKMLIFVVLFVVNDDFGKYKLKIIDISVTKEYDGVSREAGAFPSKRKGGSSMV